MSFVSRMARVHELGRGSVLDVGSYDVNGNVRELFKGARYVGIDMRAGPNVDRVVDAHDLVQTFGPESFDTVVCCEMLEHDPAFWVSMSQMGRILKPEGRMILTTRGIGFPLHEYPSDLWRFTLDAGKRLGELADLVDVTVNDDPQAPGIFLFGRKP
jgi:SAM-dependent methyltransferase